MKTTSLPPIDELVGFIQEVEPKELEVLVNEFPAYRQLLTPGQTLGSAKGIQEEELKLRMKVCISGLKAIDTKVHTELPKLKRKIRSIHRTQLIAHIITAIGGASIISLIEDQGYKWIQYVAAGLVLFASILNIIIQFKTGSIGSGGNSLQSIYEKLVDLHIEAKFHLNELLILEKVSDSESYEEAFEVIRKSNQLCVEIMQLLERQFVFG